MKKLISTSKFITAITLSFVMIAVSSCIGDSGLSKSRGTVKDFSVVQSGSGCGTKYLKYVTPYDTCVSTCPAATTTEGGYHLASATELATVKSDLTTAANTSLLKVVNGSANLCVPDVTTTTRPTNAITINTDYCSCINGKSDILNNCDTFCAAKTATDQPILYVNTTLATEITSNTKLGNLYNWCSVQLSSDDTTPQCVLNATDGTNTVNLAVTLTSGSNSFSANITTLAQNKTWILKLVENKTGSNAQSKEFQIRRIVQTTDDDSATGALQVTPVSQYTCLNYGLTTDGTTGVVSRDSYARLFYYFASNETPQPLSPNTGTTPAQVVCHDETAHPGNDSAEYDRLELIPGAFSLWDKSDSRFVAKTENAGVLTINKTLQTRLLNEYNITATLSLFQPLSSANRPTAGTAVLMGYFMIPFKDSTTKKSYCPTSTQYNGSEALMNLLGDYMDDTEGLYITEKEAEVISTGSGSSIQYKTIYGTMFARESTLMNYGFYIENGLKIRIDSSTLHTKTVNFYWPVTTTGDALIQGTRRLFTVRTFDTLAGNSSTTTVTTEATTDKRLGCVPKTN
jgi:hypothetical protein